MTHILKLPEEILLHIVFILPSKDIQTLSRVSTYFYNILNQEEIWKNIIKRENLTISNHIKIHSTPNGSLPPSKLHYLLDQNLHKNWISKKFHKTTLASQFDRTTEHFKHSAEHIAIVDSDRTVRVLGLCAREPTALANWKLEWEKNISIVFLLENFLVIGYFEDFSLSLKTFSLLSFELLWECSNSIDCRDLMRSYHQDINSSRDFIVAFRAKSITIFAVGGEGVNQVNLTEGVNVQDGIFQYPRFSAFSDKHYAHPFQVYPSVRPDQMVLVKHRIYCWNTDDFTVKTFVLENEVDPHSIFIKTALSGTHCYGLQWSKLTIWNIETCELVSQASFQVPAHMVGVGDVDVGSGICCVLLSRQGTTVKKSHLGLFSFEGKLLGKVEICGELFSITNSKLYNRRVVLETKNLGSKTVTILAADLSCLFDASKKELETVDTIQPIQIYKWENLNNVKGDLSMGESEIVKCSETEGIIVNSFWPVYSI